MAEGHDALATSDSELSETSQRGEREITPHLFLEEPGTENLDEFMLENQAIESELRSVRESNEKLEEGKQRRRLLKEELARERARNRVASGSSDLIVS